MNKKIFLNVKRTGCKKTEIIKEKEGILELNVKGKPEGGEANMEIIKFFTKKFKLNVKIIKGLKSKKKVLLLE
jgi:uncharacterized protein (TIGR00251 family)